MNTEDIIFNIDQAIASLKSASSILLQGLPKQTALVEDKAKSEMIQGIVASLDLHRFALEDTRGYIRVSKLLVK